MGKPQRPHQPPREVCTIGDAGCVCHDPRKPEGERDYILPFDACRNYQAISPFDYDAGQEWIRDNCWGPR